MSMKTLTAHVYGKDYALACDAGQEQHLANLVQQVNGRTQKLEKAVGKLSEPLMLLYTASTLYHSIPHITAKQRLKIFDHCAIYVLIAGSYTPFTLIGLRGHGGWWLFGVIWTLALAGVIFKLFYTGRFKLVSTLIYIGMGWMVIFAIKPMLQNIDTTTLAWLFTGGFFYTLGTVFYMSKKIPFTHAIWHVFVMLGSASHFVAISRQVLL